MGVRADRNRKVVVIELDARAARDFAEEYGEVAQSEGDREWARQIWDAAATIAGWGDRP